MATAPLIINLISKNDDLVDRLRKDQRVIINTVVDFKDFNHEEFDPRSTSKYVIINVQNANKEAVVFSGLFLRNAGFQVFITMLSDYDDLFELILDIRSLLEKEPDLMTELLITENATKWLGDISSIVRRFEMEVLGK